MATFLPHPCRSFASAVSPTYLNHEIAAQLGTEMDGHPTGPCTDDLDPLAARLAALMIIVEGIFRLIQGAFYHVYTPAYVSS